MARTQVLSLGVVLAALLAACGSSESTRKPAACGDGVSAGLEQCDDGNAVNGDGCDTNCTFSGCGNGIAAGGEACDDGDATSGDGCDVNCTFTACGNGVVAGTEACDTAGASATCDADCTAPSCGDGTLNAAAGESCDTSGASATCDADCTVALCGDGTWNALAGEACDDGNALNTDACLATCVAARCGDGIVWAGTEQCDGGGETAACDADCSHALCGDRTVNVAANEACDDGNAVDTDGCTSICRSGRVCDVATHPAGDRFAVDRFSGRCYVAFDDELTAYPDAQAACIASGGNLVTITSSQEDTLVTSILGASQTPWLGATDDAGDTDTVFTWVTGEPWGYTRFAASEPDDDAGTGGNGECLHVGNASGEWYDTDCGFVGYVVGRICEIACGDGALDPGEGCDDGNATSGDGCSATCQLE